VCHNQHLIKPSRRCHRSKPLGEQPGIVVVKRGERLIG
jgi:hypothetical protein